MLRLQAFLGYFIVHIACLTLPAASPAFLWDACMPLRLCPVIVSGQGVHWATSF